MESTTVSLEEARKTEEPSSSIHYAPFHIVERGKRITIFTIPVYQLDDLFHNFFVKN
jgi:hypothetical protein